MINQLEQEYNIDPARIWATGMSDGGGFCNTIACDPTLLGASQLLHPYQARSILTNRVHALQILS
jgi:poly(3-hydroxybutyrate) depolymerase